MTPAHAWDHYEPPIHLDPASTRQSPCRQAPAKRKVLRRRAAPPPQPPARPPKRKVRLAWLPLRPLRGTSARPQASLQGKRAASPWALLPSHPLRTSHTCRVGVLWWWGWWGWGVARRRRRGHGRVMPHGPMSPREAVPRTLLLLVPAAAGSSGSGAELLRLERRRGLALANGAAVHRPPASRCALSTLLLLRRRHGSTLRALPTRPRAHVHGWATAQVRSAPHRCCWRTLAVSRAQL